MVEMMRNIQTKNGQIEYLLHQHENERFSVITPSDPGHRGCQLSIRVKDADRSLFERLTSLDVVADWREPDVIRVAPAPLYNSFVDVFRFYGALEKTLEENSGTAGV